MDRWKWLVNACGQGESRKVDQIVHVLGQYNIKIAALQETKWFGSDVYQVLGAVVLTAGRSVPPLDEPVRRGEGVAFVLLNDAITSWQAAGKQWKSWSARMISASFRIGEKPCDILHVISCYAPTWGSSRAVKDEFWSHFWLQCHRGPVDYPGGLQCQDWLKDLPW